MEKLNKEIAAVKNAYLEGRNVPDIEIALASYTVLDQYRWIPYPTPNKKVDHFNKMMPDQKKKMRDFPDKHANFWMDREVRKYFDEKDKVDNHNYRNKSWLQWMKKTLADHPDKQTAIDVKLYQYTDDHQRSFPVVEQPRWE